MTDNPPLPPIAVPSSDGRAGSLVQVDLIWIEKSIERWLRFGRPVEKKILDRRRSIASFAPSSIFGFVRWASNDYGTVVSRLDIVRTVLPGERFQTLPCVHPGGEILLRADGWPKVEQVMQAVDAIEALHIDPADVAPHYWRHLHNRFAAGETPHAYTRDQHAAWLKRRSVTP